VKTRESIYLNNSLQRFADSHVGWHFEIQPKEGMLIARTWLETILDEIVVFAFLQTRGIGLADDFLNFIFGRWENEDVVRVQATDSALDVVLVDHRYGRYRVVPILSTDKMN